MTSKPKVKLLVCMVSWAKSAEHLNMTQDAITSCLQSGVEDMAVVVCEKEDQVTYNGAEVISQPERLNYNQCLNMCAEKYHFEYIAFCNNDLVFEQDWGAKIIRKMKQHDIHSMTALNPRTHIYKLQWNKSEAVTIGLDGGLHFLGWFFLWTRNLYDRLGGLPEEFEFWCADNETMKIMEDNSIRHGIYHGVTVEHLGSKTLKTLDGEEFDKLTRDPVKAWNRKYDDNKFNWGKG